MTGETPTWDQFVVPVLCILLDGHTPRMRDLYGLVADAEQLSADLRPETLLSRCQRVLTHFSYRRR